MTYRDPAEIYVNVAEELQALIDLGLPWRPRLYLLLGGKLSFTRTRGPTRINLFVEVQPPKWLKLRKWTIGFLNHPPHEKIEA